MGFNSSFIYTMICFDINKLSFETFTVSISLMNLLPSAIVLMVLAYDEQMLAASNNTLTLSSWRKLDCENYKGLLKLLDDMKILMTKFSTSFSISKHKLISWISFFRFLCSGTLILLKIQKVFLLNVDRIVSNNSN